jgi:hypothetical protein
VPRGVEALLPEVAERREPGIRRRSAPSSKRSIERFAPHLAAIGLPVSLLDRAVLPGRMRP